MERSRVVMEKPFGTDLRSAITLNDQVHETFKERQVFRIDHFLGKEAALNILAFRFANGLFEPIWNRNFIDHIQIDIPETLGLDRRANFYEVTGAYKDMVVTHLFQVLAFVAMEPPTALEPRAISEEKNKVFRSMLPLDPREVVRGQYSGYRDEDGVARLRGAWNAVLGLELVERRVRHVRDFRRKAVFTGVIDPFRAAATGRRLENLEGWRGCLRDDGGGGQHTRRKGNSDEFHCSILL